MGIKIQLVLGEKHIQTQAVLISMMIIMLFGINWSPDKIEWYVDGVIYNTLDLTNPTWGESAKKCFNRPQYIQLNLAMGGNWPGDVRN